MSQQNMSDNPSIRIHVNKIENKITFKTKTGFYVELLTPETMKLLVKALKVKKLKIKMVKICLI